MYSNFDYYVDFCTTRQHFLVSGLDQAPLPPENAKSQLANEIVVYSRFPRMKIPPGTIFPIHQKLPALCAYAEICYGCVIVPPVFSIGLDKTIGAFAHA